MPTFVGPSAFLKIDVLSGSMKESKLTIAGQNWSVYKSIQTYMKDYIGHIGAEVYEGEKDVSIEFKIAFKEYQLGVGDLLQVHSHVADGVFVITEIKEEIDHGVTTQHVTASMLSETKTMPESQPYVPVVHVDCPPKKECPNCGNQLEPYIEQEIELYCWQCGVGWDDADDASDQIEYLTPVKVDPGYPIEWQFESLSHYYPGGGKYYWTPGDHKYKTLSRVMEMMEIGDTTGTYAGYLERMKLIIWDDKGKKRMFIGSWRGARQWIYERLYVDSKEAF